MNYKQLSITVLVTAISISLVWALVLGYQDYQTVKANQLAIFKDYQAFKQADKVNIGLIASFMQQDNPQLFQKLVKEVKAQATKQEKPAKAEKAEE